MAANTAALEELKEGEYETHFGKVVLKKTYDGYKIIIHVNGSRLGRHLASQIAYSLIGPYIKRAQVA